MAQMVVKWGLPIEVGVPSLSLALRLLIQNINNSFLTYGKTSTQNTSVSLSHMGWTHKTRWMRLSSITQEGILGFSHFFPFTTRRWRQTRTGCTEQIFPSSMCSTPPFHMQALLEKADKKENSTGNGDEIIMRCSPETPFLHLMALPWLWRLKVCNLRLKKWSLYKKVCLLLSCQITSTIWSTISKFLILLIFTL